jgi:hypothetical protein
MERDFTPAGSWYADEEIHAVADRDTATAVCGGTRQWENDSASLQRSPHDRVELLPLVEGIRRTKTRLAQTSQEARAGERFLEDAPLVPLLADGFSERVESTTQMPPVTECAHP